MNRWMLFHLQSEYTSGILYWDLPSHPGHPSGINFSSEVLTPLKWYQNMIRSPYPPYDHSCHVPADFPQSHPAASSPHHHGVSSTAHGPQQPMGPVPGQHSMNPTRQHLPNFPLLMQQPSGLSPSSHRLTSPLPPQLPHPALAARAALPPVFPRQPLSPVPPGLTLEAWPATDKTKRDEISVRQMD
ncbi:hypothetical protein FD755_021013 [Muntiacus reevesi]|uniref:Uncharacterized protein n=1 Tax=Muntiacus reevesi TaxID=9886 RepID=A0A5N3X0I3_MUNRE|nr:hypothetical protein FD755_021013 [Muntiacus reevesi]